MFRSKFPYEGLFESLKDMVQIKELHKYTQTLVEELTDFELQSLKVCSSRHDHVDACLKNYFLKHPLFQILGYHPLSICMIPPLLVNKTLKELFELIMASPMFGVTEGRIN